MIGGLKALNVAMNYHLKYSDDVEPAVYCVLVRSRGYAYQ